MSSLPEKRRIPLKIPAESSRQQQSLHIRHKSPCNLFSEERMCERFLSALLPRTQESSSPFVCQQHSSAFLAPAMFSCEYSLIYARQHKAISTNTSQLLHNIQRQTASTRARAVQKAYIWVKPHTLKRRSALPRKEGIGKAQHGIDRIERRAPAAACKGKCLTLL